MMSIMNGWELALYCLTGFGMSIIGGFAGGGGGFVMTPLAIFLGLTPAQAVSTGKFAGLSITVGSLFGMKKAKGVASKKKVIPIMVLAFFVGLLSPFAIASLDSEVYRTLLAVIILMMVPVMVIKKVGITPRQPQGWQRFAGGGLLTIALFLQGIFSGGMGMLVNVVLMGMLGMTAVEANITKRWSQVILNTTIIVGVILSGLVVWEVAIASVITTFAGSYVGGRLAVSKGDGFIVKIMIGMMIASALALLFGM
jgi:uncharacterized membrane protein YfcA